MKSNFLFFHIDMVFFGQEESHILFPYLSPDNSVYSDPVAGLVRWSSWFRQNESLFIFKDERELRMSALRHRERTRDIHFWVKSFLQATGAYANMGSPELEPLTVPVCCHGNRLKCDNCRATATGSLNFPDSCRCSTHFPVYGIDGCDYFLQDSHTLWPWLFGEYHLINIEPKYK